MVVAVTEESTTGEKVARPKSPKSTSTAKSAPAIGALKVAAIPAAAPQPTRVLCRMWGALSICARLEPMDEPIWTIGPSRPTEPPEPIEMPEARIFTKATLGRMRPPLSATASMTSGTPCPLASRAPK